MKKSNIITVAVFVLLIAAVLAFMVFGKSGKQPSETTTDSTKPLIVSTTDESVTAENTTAENTTAQNVTKAPLSAEDTAALMKDTLFIGDSRTVGISEYAGLSEANFFANVGMTVFNIFDKQVSVPGVGKVTLDKLLSAKKYGKIFVMLGINELGYDFNKLVSKYGDLVDYLEKKQPDAKIIIQANLHVTAERSNKDDYINNTRINQLNESISKFADGKRIFYINANPVFDDAKGNLSSEKSEDNAHLLAKYYKQWGEWIVSETAEICREE